MNCRNSGLNNSMTFEEVLLEAIDEGLACLGGQAKKTVYLHLKNKYALCRQNIPYRIENFTEALEDTFEAGAGLLEIKIMKILYTKAGYGYVPIETPDSLDFTNYIYALRNRGLFSCLSQTFRPPQRKCEL
jgi:hypothetical protein